MRGSFRRLTVVVLVVTAICAALVVEQARYDSVRADGGEPPNVVVILVDDANFREIQYLPNVQALLASQGTSFPNYYDSTPVCCPARAGIMSGQYNGNNKVRSNQEVGKFNHNNQLGRWLHDAGYQTALMGKYMNGYSCGKPIPPGWDHWQSTCKGTNQQYKYTINDNGHLAFYGTAEADYQVDVLSQRTVATINEFSENPDPFFVYVAPTVPHAPLQIARRHLKSDVATPEPSPALDEADVSDKPAWIQALPRLNSKQEGVLAKQEKARMRMLLAADDLVKATVDALTERGEIDNTVIMFMNDNGFMRGEHRIRIGKGDVYRESVNSGPLIVRGPGIAAGATNEAVVGNVDLAPTIADLAGATPTRVIDGQSIVPLLSDPEAGAGRVYLHYLAAQKLGMTKVAVADGLHTSRYAYFRYRDAGGTEELYDYAHDPYELQNVASDPDYADVKAALRAILTPLVTCTGTSCHVTFDDQGPISETTTTSTSTTTTTTTTTIPEETTTTTVPEETTTTTVVEEETTTTTVAAEETTTTIEPPLGE